MAYMPMDDFHPDWSGSFSGAGKLFEFGSWEQPDFCRRAMRLNPSDKSEWCKPWSPHLDLNSRTVCEVFSPMGQFMSEMKH